LTNIARMRESFARSGQPIISIDTKKKELIGNFRNAGRSWEREPIGVLDHDFRSDAKAIAVPCGIYDCQHNEGLICVGTSGETRLGGGRHRVLGRHQRPLHLPDATELLISPIAVELMYVALGFSGGGFTNSSANLTTTVTLCHYPPELPNGIPIEHRLFSEISKLRADHW
jgi:hypothetical protein